jgi:hypothetical protein
MICKVSITAALAMRLFGAPVMPITVVLPFHGVPPRHYRHVLKPPSSKSRVTKLERRPALQALTFTFPIPPSRSFPYNYTNVAAFYHYSSRLFPFSRWVLTPSHRLGRRRSTLRRTSDPPFHTISIRNHVPMFLTSPHSVDRRTRSLEY